MDFLAFEPIYKERVWGGVRLNSILGRKLPSGRIGESWEIVDRKDDQSVASGGEFKGKSLNDILCLSGGEIMGPRWKRGTPFPVLVKWLDCKERLSLQVHPPRHKAVEMGGEPKSENWYVLHGEGDAHLIVGLVEGVTALDFRRLIEAGNAEQCLKMAKVKAGDSLFVPSGRLHAIGGGNLILEIQENSDTTYRVYDWGRLGLDGKPRKLHIEESLECINFEDDDLSVKNSLYGDHLLAECDSFRLQKKEVPEKGLIFAANEQPKILSVVDGEVLINGLAISKGMNILLPYNKSFQVHSKDQAHVLITDNFFKN